MDRLSLFLYKAIPNAHSKDLKGFVFGVLSPELPLTGLGSPKQLRSLRRMLGEAIYQNMNICQTLPSKRMFTEIILSRPRASVNCPFNNVEIDPNFDGGSWNFNP